VAGHIFLYPKEMGKTPLTIDLLWSAESYIRNQIYRLTSLLFHHQRWRNQPLQTSDNLLSRSEAKTVRSSPFNLSMFQKPIAFLSKVIKLLSITSLLKSTGLSTALGPTLFILSSLKISLTSLATRALMTHSKPNVGPSGSRPRLLKMPTSARERYKPH
jgi:hypothetical protein